MELSLSLNEKSSLLDSCKSGSLDIDSLIQRLICNNSSYHKAYMRNGCSRSAKTYSESLANRRASSTFGSISSLLSRTKSRVHSDSNHSANIVMTEIHGDALSVTDLDGDGPNLQSTTMTPS